ncbi:MAG TPA: MBL fold metallo-hydrolase [Gemmatimonadaceae bacterium]|nr:MBL fold metallo-hydrolase [Gemmatimonadaceae bacterium]
MTAPPPLLQTRRIGRLTVHAIQAGGQKLDGGAMFGVVPKPLWEKRIAPDERNRIALGMRCLLIEHEAGLVLVDTGAGNKENAKFRDIYGIENDGSSEANGAGEAGGVRRTALEDGIRAAGHRIEDVALVINTHLHFDHAGGDTFVDGAGVVRPSFPGARYVVQAGEHHFATHANERTAASYFPRNWEPVREAGRLELVEGDREIVPGISVLRTPGHVPHHQSVLVSGGGEVACFLGDICPTAAHLPLPWIMGYDVEPLVTLETKRWLFARAERERWLLVFEHDAGVAWGRIRHDGKAYGLVNGDDE